MAFYGDEKHDSDNVEVSFYSKKKSISRETVGEHLMDYMLAIIGKTRIDMIDAPNYRFDFTMTREEYIAFGEYAIFVLQKTFKFNKKKAHSTFNWFYKKFGVRLKG